MGLHISMLSWFRIPTLCLDISTNRPVAIGWHEGELHWSFKNGLNTPLERDILFYLNLLVFVEI